MATEPNNSTNKFTAVAVIAVLLTLAGVSSYNLNAEAEREAKRECVKLMVQAWQNTQTEAKIGSEITANACGRIFP
jgi:hypothetical protein